MIELKMEGREILLNANEKQICAFNHVKGSVVAHLLIHLQEMLGFCKLGFILCCMFINLFLLLF